MALLGATFGLLGGALGRSGVGQGAAWPRSWPGEHSRGVQGAPKLIFELFSITFGRFGTRVQSFYLLLGLRLATDCYQLLSDQVSLIAAWNHLTRRAGCQDDVKLNKLPQMKRRFVKSLEII